MKKIITLIICAAVLFTFCSCGNNTKTADETAQPTSEAADSAEVTPEPTDYVSDYTTRVLALKGPTGMGAVQLFDKENYSITLSSAPTDLTAEIIAGRYDIAALPTNLAATLYNKTSGKLKVIALNTLGVLYILENGNTVNSIADLKGKTIGATGEGSTPEYVLNYILTSNGLTLGVDVTINYYAEHSELTTQLVAGNVDIGMLPQPNVATALAKNSQLRIAIDLTAEWNKISPDSQLTQGCFVASTDYIENHPEELKQFLKDYAASANFVNENVDEAAAKIALQGIVPSETIAKKAIPDCNIVCVEGAEMKATLSGFLKVLFDANPKSVGGTLPDDGFYY